MTPTAELSRQSKTTLATRRFESPSSSLCGRSASARPGQQTLMILQSMIDSVFPPYLDRMSKALPADLLFTPSLPKRLRLQYTLRCVTFVSVLAVARTVEPSLS
jgi:hypothetical protein